MNALKIELQYGEIHAPKCGSPFIDHGPNRHIIVLKGDIDEIDGEALGREMFKALSEIEAASREPRIGEDAVVE